MKNEVMITKDAAARKITVVREFNAPVQKVWDAFTQPHILDQWWAPKPWRAETKSMDFRPGGYWLYAMAGPDGAKHWSRANFQTINTPENYTADAIFCDAEGVAVQGAPASHWQVHFSKTEAGTKVQTVLTFDETATFEMLVQMGFEGGYTMGLNQLGELLGE